jgi:hypothetical protein
MKDTRRGRRGEKWEGNGEKVRERRKERDRWSERERKRDRRIWGMRDNVKGENGLRRRGNWGKREEREWRSKKSERRGNRDRRVIKCLSLWPTLCLSVSLVSICLFLCAAAAACVRTYHYFPSSEVLNGWGCKYGERGRARTQLVEVLEYSGVQQTEIGNGKTK